MRTTLYIIISAVILVSCNTVPSKNIVLAAETTQPDTMAAECPYLTKDAKGRTVVSWVRMINDSTTAFCYALTVDGKTFSAPVIIPESGNIEPHGENMPKIIFKPSGEVIALWGAANPNSKNKYSGIVFYTQSPDSGKTWTTPRPLVNDTASYDQRYYDVALLPNGEVGIIWLDNRKTTDKEGSALFYASTNGNRGFEAGKLISQPCCQCCRTDLFVDTKGGIHALFRGIVQDSIRDMVHIVSTDAGKTFSAPQRISNDNWVLHGCPHTGPSMTENKEGIHFAWFTGGKNKGCFYTKSTDNGRTFTMHDSVSALGSHPQIAPLENGGLIIAWDESFPQKDVIGRRIGIQSRSASGSAQQTTYIEDGNGQLSYPVVTNLNGQSSLIAYTINRAGRDYVACRVVEVN